MGKINKYKLCKGCAAYDHREIFCSFDNNEEKCPCTTCLVKVMCESFCDLYTTERNKLHESRYG